MKNLLRTEARLQNHESDKFGYWGDSVEMVDQIRQAWDKIKKAGLDKELLLVATHIQQSSKSQRDERDKIDATGKDHVRIG